MWIALTLLLVIGCGALGGFVKSFAGQPGQPRTGQKGARSRWAFIGGLMAVAVVGLLSQSAFSESVKKLFQPTVTDDVFQPLILVASVALVAGLAGQTLLNSLFRSLLKERQKMRDQFEESVTMKRKIRNAEFTTYRAAIAVREGHFEVGIQLLEAILKDTDVPEWLLARAHGVIANAKKKIGLLDEAVNHVDKAHRLSPDDYRFLFNRACYRWMVNNNAIDEVLQDLRQSIEKGLSLDEIERDEDLATLRKHERFKELKDDHNRKEGS